MMLDKFDLIKGKGADTLRVYTDSGSTPRVNSIVVVPQAGGSAKALVGLLESEVAVGVVAVDCVSPMVKIEPSDSKHAQALVFVTRDYTEIRAQPGEFLKIEMISKDSITVKA